MLAVFSKSVMLLGLPEDQVGGAEDGRTHPKVKQMSMLKFAGACLPSLCEHFFQLSGCAQGLARRSLKRFTMQWPNSGGYLPVLFKPALPFTHLFESSHAF